MKMRHAFSGLNELGSASGRAIGNVERDAVGPDTANVSFRKFVAGDTSM